MVDPEINRRFLSDRAAALASDSAAMKRHGNEKSVPPGPARALVPLGFSLTCGKP
jgi:hypothetical protein